MIQTLAQLLRARTEEQPDRSAYIFLKDGEVESARLTFRTLDRRARAIGALLQGMGMQGERALLLLPPGLDFVAAFFGCLYAGAVAVPAYPPRSHGRQSMLAGIVDDARPAVILSVAAIARRAEELSQQVPGLAGVPWAAIDGTGEAEEERQSSLWTEPRLDEGSLAMLQYTSGSTSSPKGVMVSHGNLLHNEEMIRQAFRQSPESVIVSWLPLFHDMGLIGGMLQPLYLGGSCILLSPMAFLQRPLRWLEAISHYRATTSGGPSFAYELCLAKTRPEERRHLDLSSWSVAFVGAEPVRACTLERFAREFAPCGFRREALYPCYGLAEATLFVTGGEERRPPVVARLDAIALRQNRVRRVARDAGGGTPAVELVGCGKAWDGQRVRIVDPVGGGRCREEEVGEIWVSGPSLAQGYWGQPEATETTFRARLAEAPDEGPYLRTGDLGFMAAGELFITGRLKDLLILRGRNHYPQDIELTVERSHPVLRPGCGAAFTFEDEGEERLVVAHEVNGRQPLDAQAVVAAILRQVAEEHEIRIHGVLLLEPGGIPKTSSGKIRRGACRSAYLAGTLPVVAAWQGGRPGDDPEEAGPGLPDLLALSPGERSRSVVGFLRRQVGIHLGVPPSHLSAERPLTELGLDSLIAIELQHKVESRFGVSLPPAHLLGGVSLAELTEEIGECLGGGSEAALAESRDPVGPPQGALCAPLSYEQQALWFLERLIPGNGAYNIGAAVRIRQGLDVQALERAVHRLIERHPALRTTFGDRSGELEQRIHPLAVLPFMTADVSSWSERALLAHLEGEFYRPFDLAVPPLLRVWVGSRGEDEHVVLLAAHHLVADFWSASILLRDLAGLYGIETGSGVKLAPPSPFSSIDYMRVQRQQLAGERGEQLWQYWQRQLAGLPKVELPADGPRPGVPSFTGAAEVFHLDVECSRQIRHLAWSRGVTPFTALLAGFLVVLSRHANRPDVLVGSPMAGRRDSAFAGVVGYFVNALPLRCDLADDPSFVQLLARLQEIVIDAMRHQDLPLLLLAERLRPERDPGHSPLFQVMFALQTARHPDERDLAALALRHPAARISLGDLELESVPLGERTSQFELTLAIAQAGDAFWGFLQYLTALFDPSTVRRLGGHFQTFLQSAVAAPDCRLSQLSLFTAAERQQLRVEWPGEAVQANGTDCLHELFSRIAVERKTELAVRCSGEALSYGELAARSDRLAALLRRQGVGLEMPVGVLLDRSPALPVALLGVLKAGGSCVPLDLAWGRTWCGRALEQAAVPVLVTSELLRMALPEHGAAVICVNGLGREDGGRGARLPGTGATPRNLAFLVHGSGRQSQPRLVAWEHGSLARWVRQWSAELTAGELRGLVTASPLGTLESVLELLAPLLTGGTVVMARGWGREEGEPPGARLLCAPPSTLAEGLRRGWWGRGAAAVRAAGEPLTRRLCERIFADLGSARIYNAFSSTVAGSWAWSVSRPGAPAEPWVCRALASPPVWVLDSAGRPAPIGARGELWIGGEGSARGFWRDPERTAERFRPDAFGGRQGTRLLRTGDWARWRRDGSLELLGPRLTVRGGEMDLHALERHLTEHPAIDQASVSWQEGVGGGARLVIHAVSRNGILLEPGEVRELLRERVPDASLLWSFVGLETLPLTPSGRLDEGALPRPEEEAAPRFVAARTEVERMLSEIWRELLAIDRVGIHDNFFHCGGNSLLAIQAIARINDSFQLNLDPGALFKRSTVADLALAVDEQLASQLGDYELAAFLAQTRQE